MLKWLYQDSWLKIAVSDDCRSIAHFTKFSVAAVIVFKKKTWKCAYKAKRENYWHFSEMNLLDEELIALLCNVSHGDGCICAHTQSAGCSQCRLMGRGNKGLQQCGAVWPYMYICVCGEEHTYALDRRLENFWATWEHFF